MQYMDYFKVCVCSRPLCPRPNIKEYLYAEGSRDTGTPSDAVGWGQFIRVKITEMVISVKQYLSELLEEWKRQSLALENWRCILLLYLPKSHTLCS